MTKQSYTPKFKQDAIQYYLDHRDHMKLSEMPITLESVATPCISGSKSIKNQVKLVVAQAIMPVIRIKKSPN